MELEELILRQALKNAWQHDGKASIGAVINKVLGEKPELKQDMKTLALKVREIVEKVNSKSFLEIEEELKEKWPEAMEKRDEERHDLPELPKAVKGRVVMRMAPNPNGAMHLGHARQLLLNWFYVRKYNGKLILRFDDTDPKVKKPLKEAYEWWFEDLEWLGVKPDEVIYASDRLEIYHEYAEKLIKMGKAYVCTCKPEEFREYKNNKKPCPCRGLSAGEQLKRWEKMFSEYREGEAVLRVKTDIEHPNPALRDWPAFRIVEKPEHPRIDPENPPRVWPLLNFNSAIDDHLTGVTHIIRGRDLDFTEKQQRFLYEHFGWEYPVTIVTGKLNLEGAVLSCSKIAEGISKGEYKGWDDEKLGTIRALKKRGITADGIKQLIWDLGIRKNNATVTWANLEAADKKALNNKTFKE